MINGHRWLARGMCWVCRREFDFDPETVTLMPALDGNGAELICPDCDPPREPLN